MNRMLDLPWKKGLAKTISDRIVTTLGIFEDSVMTIELGRFNDEFCRAVEVAR